MNIKYYLSFLFLLCSVTSCNKFLEVKPTDFITPQAYYNTEKDLNDALAGVYDVLGQESIYGNQYPLELNRGTDEEHANNMQQPKPSVYLYDSSNAIITAFWQGLYTGIERANNLLANINKPVMNEEKRNRIKGEALFLRAYCYFMLVTGFGDVPLSLNPTTAVNNLQVPRSPIKVVYAQIIKDMTEADDLLKNQTAASLGYGGKVSQSTVEGILARVNLYMAGYPLKDETRYAEVIKWTQKVITSGQHALNPDFTQIFKNYAADKYDVKESIWEIEFWGNNVGQYKESGRLGAICGPASAVVADNPGYCYGNVKASGKVRDLYEIDPASTTNPKASLDTRRDWTVCPYWYNTGTVKLSRDPWHWDLGKWRREFETLLPKDKNYTPENFPVLRYADILLMYAEAENELNGPTQQAYSAVNQVRARAYGKLMPGATDLTRGDLPVGLTKDQFRKWLQDERAREFCGEALRKADLIRWGIFIQTMKEYVTYVQVNAPAIRQYAAQAGINVTNRDLLYPIPLRELNINKNLTQNPGW